MTTLRILGLCFVLSMFGCAFAVEPVPGVAIGADVSPSNVGVEFDINPLGSLCEIAKAVSWNWAENTICPQVPVGEIPRVADTPTPEIHQHD